MISLVYIVLCLIVAIIYLNLFAYNYWKSRGVPHKLPIFPFGNILDVLFTSESIGKYIGQLCNEFEGPYVGFYSLFKPILIINDPKLIKTVLITDFHIFTNRSFLCDEKIDVVVSCSLMGIRSPEWQCLRTKWMKVLNSGTTKLMDIMKNSGENLHKFLLSNLDKNLEMKSVMSRYSTDVIIKCTFGSEDNFFGDCHRELFAHADLVVPNKGLQLFKTISYVMVPNLVKLLKYPFVDSKAVTFFRKYFRNNHSNREENNVNCFIKGIENLNTKKDIYKLYGDRLLAQAITFLVAGNVNISSVISFLLHELAMHQHMQDRVRREIQENIQNTDDITYEVLQNMPYLQSLIEETLRKYPFTPFVHRECSEDYVFAETGLKIDKGTTIIVPQHSLFFDPVHFPNPTVFDPERFSNKNKHKINDGVYLPFGIGPRDCVGKRFGLMCIKVGLIYLIKNFKLEPNSKTIEPLIFNKSPALESKCGINLNVTKIQ